MPARKTPRRTASNPDAERPVVRFRLRITAGEVIAIGPGKIALLEAIDTTGSITAAARHLDMSYRRAWLLLDELNRALKRAAVDTSKGGPQGGGSALTATGRRVIALYRRIEADAARACKADLVKLVGLLST